MAKNAENFNRLSRVHERYRRQTDDRQMTDGRTMTYSEHEREFTFAKNESGFLLRFIMSISKALKYGPCVTIEGSQFLPATNTPTMYALTRVYVKVADFDTNRILVCDFLLMNNPNLHPILHRFQVIGFDRG